MGFRRQRLLAIRNRPPSKMHRKLIRMYANSLGVSVHQLLRQFGMKSLASHYDAARVVEAINTRKQLSSVNKVVVI